MLVDSFSIRAGSQTLIAGRIGERERERDCMVLAHESFALAWFLRISKHTNQSCYNCFR